MCSPTHHTYPHATEIRERDTNKSQKRRPGARFPGATGSPAPHTTPAPPLPSSPLPYPLGPSTYPGSRRSPLLGWASNPFLSFLSLPPEELRHRITDGWAMHILFDALVGTIVAQMVFSPPQLAHPRGAWHEPLLWCVSAASFTALLGSGVAKMMMYTTIQNVADEFLPFSLIVSSVGTSITAWPFLATQLGVEVALLLITPLTAAGNLPGWAGYAGAAASFLLALGLVRVGAEASRLTAPLVSWWWSPTDWLPPLARGGARAEAAAEAARRRERYRAHLCKAARANLTRAWPKAQGEWASFWALARGPAAPCEGSDAGAPGGPPGQVPAQVPGQVPGPVPSVGREQEEAVTRMLEGALGSPALVGAVGSALSLERLGLEELRELAAGGSLHAVLRDVGLSWGDIVAIERGVGRATGGSGHGGGPAGRRGASLDAH